jgi:hypothetical protein
MMAVRLLVACLAVGVLCGSGCSQGRRGPKTVQVAGTLFLDGKPLEGAEVRFYSGDFVSVAVSGSGGKYELVQGGVPGENKVTVRKVEGAQVKLDPDSGFDQGQLDANLEAVQQGNARAGGKKVDVGPKQLVPAHYADADKTKLTYSVPDGGTDSADLRLTTK